MEPDIQQIIDTLEFRVFIDFDEQYGAYVAHCIESGATATGQTMKEAEDLIKAILRNDFRHAIEAGSLKSLFHGETPFEAKVGWYETQAMSPESIRHISLEISTGPEKRGVQSERKPQLTIIGKDRTSAA